MKNTRKTQSATKSSPTKAPDKRKAILEERDKLLRNLLKSKHFIKEPPPNPPFTANEATLMLAELNGGVGLDPKMRARVPAMLNLYRTLAELVRQLSAIPEGKKGAMLNKLNKPITIPMGAAQRMLHQTTVENIRAIQGLDLRQRRAYAKLMKAFPCMIREDSSWVAQIEGEIGDLQLNTKTTGEKPAPRPKNDEFTKIAREVIDAMDLKNMNPSSLDSKSFRKKALRQILPEFFKSDPNLQKQLRNLTKSDGTLAELNARVGQTIVSRAETLLGIRKK